jgi:hypothetical protein
LDQDQSHQCLRRAASLGEQFPWLEQSGVIDVIFPKKEPVYIGKWCVAVACRAARPPPLPTARRAARGRLPRGTAAAPTRHAARPAAHPRSGFVQLVLINNVILFFQERDGPWFPTLRLLHQ